MKLNNFIIDDINENILKDLYQNFEPLFSTENCFSITQQFLDDSYYQNKEESIIHNSFEKIIFKEERQSQNNKINTNFLQNTIYLTNEEKSNNYEIKSSIFPISVDCGKERENDIQKTDAKLNDKKSTFNPCPEEKEKIFLIIKKKSYHGLGRTKKSSKEIRKHNRNSNDNLKRKAKGDFLNNLYLYLLSRFKINRNKKTGKLIKVLKKINPQQKNRIGKEYNSKWINLKIKDIFSVDINKKFEKYGKDFNTKKINEIMIIKKEDKVIELLNKNVKDLLKIYLYENDKYEEYKGFEKLNDVIKRLELYGENSNYIGKYKMAALSLIPI